MHWYFLGLKKYAVWKGRASRLEYWMYMTYSFLFSLIFLSLDYFDINHYLDEVYHFIVFLPSLAITVRRLHDQERSAWHLLLFLIPLIGSITLVLLMMRKGTDGDNYYDLAPYVNIK